jgi:hypothetical protein
MRNRSFAVAGIIVLGVATTPSAMAFDHAGSFGTKRAPYVYAAPGYQWRSGWRVNGHRLPFGPGLKSALFVWLRSRLQSLRPVHRSLRLLRRSLPL